MQLSTHQEIAAAGGRGGGTVSRTFRGLVNMPHTQQGIAFSGVTPQSLHASHQGAEAIAPKQPTLILRYLGALRDAGDRGLTDQEAAVLLDVKPTTICGRRNECLAFGLVEPNGFRDGDSGVRVTVWVLAKAAA